MRCLAFIQCCCPCIPIATDPQAQLPNSTFSLTENLDRLPDGPYPIHDYLDDTNPSEAFHAGSGIQVDVAERRKDIGTRR